MDPPSVSIHWCCRIDPSFLFVLWGIGSGRRIIVPNAWNSVSFPASYPSNEASLKYEMVPLDPEQKRFVLYLCTHTTIHKKCLILCKRPTSSQISHQTLKLHRSINSRILLGKTELSTYVGKEKRINDLDGSRYYLGVFNKRKRNLDVHNVSEPKEHAECGCQIRALSL